MHTFLVAAQIIVSLGLIITILKQPGKSDGFNLVSSGAETFLSKNKTKTYESVLAKSTVILGTLFAIITIALTLVK